MICRSWADDRKIYGEVRYRFWQAEKPAHFDYSGQPRGRSRRIIS